MRNFLILANGTAGFLCIVAMVNELGNSRWSWFVVFLILSLLNLIAFTEGLYKYIQRKKTK